MDVMEKVALLSLQQGMIVLTVYPILLIAMIKFLLLAQLTVQE